jgi:predicted Zn-dependent protease
MATAPLHSDFQIRPGVWFGEWLNQEISENAYMERRDFFADRVRTVAERLQRDRPEAERFIVEIPWISVFTAFTAPGRYIYIARRLLERCPDEETTAFVIAHEIAHHDLGHLAVFRGPFARHAARMEAGRLTVLFFRHLQKRIYSPVWECDADARAIELCIAAGYDPIKCLRLFHIIEMHMLDVGDIDGVYGLDPESDQELAPDADWRTRARIWFWLRRRGYLPVQDRRARVRAHLEAL